MDHEALLKLAQDEAMDDADKAFGPEYNWARVNWYRDRVVRKYLERISPIPYGRIVEIPRAADSATASEPDAAPPQKPSC